jgi:tetratricopeptide (TPR) repeat protein
MRALVVVLLLASTAAGAHADRATARAYMEAGDLRATAGDKDGALDRYRHALDADPDMIAVYDKAIPLWIAGGRWAEAATYLERATLRHPGFAHAWYALGYIYRQERRFEAAIAAYQESTALQAGDSEPWFGLAASYEAAGRGPDAIVAYRTYRRLERDPARASYRRDARAAIDRLLGAPADWSDALWRLVLDGGDRAALVRAAKLAR